MEPVEERPGVLRRGRLEPAPAQRRRELADVARHQLRIEAEVAPAQEDLVGAEVLAQGVDRLAQAAAGAVFLGVGPEIGEDLLAGQPRLARRGEQRHEREPARLRRGAADDAVGATHVQSAEGMNAQHVALGDSEVIEA